MDVATVRHLLPSGWKWVKTTSKEPYHIVGVETHWREAYARQVFDYWKPLERDAECKEPKQQLNIYLCTMSVTEAEACPACWSIRERY